MNHEGSKENQKKDHRIGVMQVNKGLPNPLALHPDVRSGSHGCKKPDLYCKSPPWIGCL